jgi:outer membrane biosynthesis protein TonB
MRVECSACEHLMLGLLLIAWLACGKDTSSTAAPATGPAGKVVEVTGKVSATRGAATRTLVAQAEVFADDVVETAADASVVILLAHNNARWSLEGGLRSRVDESVAWKLEKQEIAGTVEHATSAAGRHADRQSATTKESALVEDERARDDKDRLAEQPPAPVSATSDAKVEKQVPTPKPALEQNKPDPKPQAAETKVERDEPKREVTAPRTRGAACDEVACVLSNYDGPCCAKFKKSAGAKASGAAAGDVSGALDPAMIRAAIGAVKDKVRACADKHAAKGTVKVAITVNPAGTVAAVAVKETPDPALGACVAAAVKTATFPKSTGTVTFTFPFAF